MTENEAIEILRNNFPKTCKKVDGRYKGGFDDVECELGKAILLSISALNGIQQYRALGKVEFLSDMKNHYVEVLSDLRQYQKIGTVKKCEVYKAIAEKYFSKSCLDMKIIDELQEYKNIGTVEECREASEKQRAKKPVEYEDKYYACPVCNNVLMYKWEKYPSQLKDKKCALPYCLSCGQAIVWSE